jgi:hypothetical protein
MTEPIRHLLRDIFNYDFSACKDSAAFHKHFFSRAITISDLAKVYDTVAAEKVTLGGKTIPAAILIKGKKPAALPFAILAQLHGNEAAGLAGILLAMALSEAGKLEQDVVGVVGNPLAARQYFEAYAKHPKARQETRDAFRCGIAEDGSLLPDMNRIPSDFMTREPSTHHIRRAQELFTLGQHISGIADLHTARGNMVCITDHKRDQDLKYSPLRAVLTGLAGAISANASKGVTVQTLKAILHPLSNIKCHMGIEAGKHELPEAPENAGSFTLSLLYNLGLTTVTPREKKDNGIFERYEVKPRLTYAQLVHDKKALQTGDRVYMAKECLLEHEIPHRCGQVIVRRKDGGLFVQSILQFIVSPGGKLCFAVYQYDEMEAIKNNQIVAVAVPSGATFKMPEECAGIFFSKSGILYDKDPAVGPWPVPVEKLAETKFCYPCDVSEWKIDFD